MKAIIILLFLSLPVQAEVQDLLSLGGLSDLVAEVSKKAKGASLVNLEQEVSGALYVSIWTLHNAVEPRTDYLELAAGAELKENRGRPLLTLAANLPALSGKLLSSAWAKSHIERLPLPPIWVGPYVRVPFPGEPWTLKDSIGVILSIAIGGKK